MLCALAWIFSVLNSFSRATRNSRARSFHGCTNKSSLHASTSQTRHVLLCVVTYTHAITRVAPQAKDEPILDYIEALVSEMPNVKLDVCCHYSLKYQRQARASPQATADNLLAFLHRLAKQPGASTSCLVVSGGGKAKHACDTVFALQHLERMGSNGVPPIHVAFNPYLPAGVALDEERQRLRRKLKTGLVAGIYLQMGCDLQVCLGVVNLQQLGGIVHANHTGTERGVGTVPGAV